MPKRREALRADAVQSPLGKIKQFASDTPPARLQCGASAKKLATFWLENKIFLFLHRITETQCTLIS